MSFFFLIGLTSVSICGPVDFQKVMLEKGEHGILSLHGFLVWCGYLFSADIFLRVALARRLFFAATDDSIAASFRIQPMAPYGVPLVSGACITLSWRGFRTRIIYSLFQTNINKRLDVWTERREICKSTQPTERPGWEQRGNQKCSGYRPTSTALRAEANVWHSCVT